MKKADRVGEVVACKTLKLHPKNVRLHNEENLAAIMSSLKQFGQRKPIVVDMQRQILAGNGTFTAAQRLGWKTIQVVWTTLKGREAEAYAIADNKTGDLSTFDFSALPLVLKRIGNDFDTGFKKYEIEPLLAADWSPKERSGDDNVEEIGLNHIVKFSAKEWDAIKKRVEAVDAKSEGAAIVKLLRAK